MNKRSQWESDAQIRTHCHCLSLYSFPQTDSQLSFAFELYNFSFRLVPETHDRKYLIQSAIQIERVGHSSNSCTTVEPHPWDQNNCPD